ncbi:unnamed protein product [Polarella glacialis]|uniref:Reverse transcriptase domain-containing protein n=1 Tax=Polarella glacialis TaxID=89957 RepID=A0A813E2Y1_POLGL|nr:unnamed protein product [Polarella glacialis]CAE8743600.1 unnamed protein product [Polarella glacialis]
MRNSSIRRPHGFAFVSQAKLRALTLQWATPFSWVLEGEQSALPWTLSQVEHTHSHTREMQNAGRGAASASAPSAENEAAMDKAATVRTVGISKFFDMLPWQLLGNLLGQLQLPRQLCAAIAESWRTFRRFYQCGKTLGVATSAARGLPQGCPLSPILSLLLMTPVLTWLQAEGVDCVSFADDLSLLGNLEALQEVLPTIRKYVNTFQMKLNPAKSLWATVVDPDGLQMQELKNFLEEQQWGALASSILLNLGVLLRFDSEQGDGWEDLQGQREILYQKRMRRAKNIPDTRIRV